MKKSSVSYIYWVVFFVLVIVIIIGTYGYNTGSCKINKKYPCSDDFCLYKEFNVSFREPVKNEIDSMMDNKQIQKRVNIETFQETILNCALPNKKGVTISTANVVKHAPNLVDFYKNDLCKMASDKLKMKLFPTDVNLPTSCVILIYENEGDWINWHYDHNYYDGRFFTLLVPITTNATCTEFQFMNDKNEVKSVNMANGNSICFEGNYLYHRASKLCKNEKRAILSCQYVTDNNMSTLNKIRLKLKDFAYTGKIGIF